MNMGITLNRARAAGMVPTPGPMRGVVRHVVRGPTPTPTPGIRSGMIRRGFHHSVFFPVNGAGVTGSRAAGVTRVMRCVGRGPSTGVALANCTSGNANSTTFGSGVTTHHTRAICGALTTGNITGDHVVGRSGNYHIRPFRRGSVGHIAVYVTGWFDSV